MKNISRKMIGKANRGEDKMEQNFITLTIGKQKNIALIAHDNKKKEFWTILLMD